MSLADYRTADLALRRRLKDAVEQGLGVMAERGKIDLTSQRAVVSAVVDMVVDSELFFVAHLPANEPSKLPVTMRTQSAETTKLWAKRAAEATHLLNVENGDTVAIPINVPVQGDIPTSSLSPPPESAPTMKTEPWQPPPLHGQDPRHCKSPFATSADVGVSARGAPECEDGVAAAKQERVIRMWTAGVEVGEIAKSVGLPLEQVVAAYRWWEMNQRGHRGRR